MAISNIKAELPSDIEKVWAVITSFDSSWRSALEKIERIDENTFTETDKNGIVTRFTITASEPYSLYEFDIENDNISGYWTGRLSIKNGVTVIDFTENIIPKKAFMKLFIKGYLKKTAGCISARSEKGA